MVEGIDARRSDDARLARRPAEQVLQPAGLGDQRRATGEHGAHRAAEPLRQAERHQVEGRAELRRWHAERDRRVQHARAVEVQGEAELAGGGRDVGQLVEAPHGAACAVVGVLERDDARARVVVGPVGPHGGAQLLAREAAEPSGQPTADQARVHGRAALLADEDVRALLADQLLARPREDAERELVGKRRRREKERRLLAEQLRPTPLQLVDGRVLARVVITDLGVRHGGPHRRRRTGLHIAAQLDHAADSSIPLPSTGGPDAS